MENVVDTGTGKGAAIKDGKLHGKPVQLRYTMVIQKLEIMPGLLALCLEINLNLL